MKRKRIFLLLVAVVMLVIGLTQRIRLVLQYGAPRSIVQVTMPAIWPDLWQTHCSTKYWYQPSDPINLLYFETCAYRGVRLWDVTLVLVHWENDVTGHPVVAWSTPIMEAGLVWGRERP